MQENVPDLSVKKEGKGSKSHEREEVENEAKKSSKTDEVQPKAKSIICNEIRVLCCRTNRFNMTKF